MLVTCLGNLRGVVQMLYAFNGCTALRTITVDSDWALPASGVSGSMTFYNYKQLAGRQGNSVRKIVVYYTGTEASAHNNLLYFSRESAKASAHCFIDRDGTLRQSVAEGDTAWHAGHWATNLCSVGIEVVSGGSDFTEAQICTLAELVADLRGRYGVSAENVIRHYDVTGKLCPAPYVDASKWAGCILGSAGARFPRTLASWRSA